MELREDRIKRVITAISLSRFCFKETRFPRAFYDELNDQERAEVVKRIKGGS